MRKILLVAILVAWLPACAPTTLTDADARAAMTARMERPGARTVKVQQIHAFELSECTDTAATGTVTCLVRMDVSFEYGGVTQRDDASERMRFVREGGEWAAQPLP